MKWHYTLETKSLIVTRNESEGTATFTTPNLPDLSVKLDVIYNEAEREIKVVAIQYQNPANKKPELRELLYHLDFCSDLLMKVEHPYNGLYASGEVAIEVNAHYTPKLHEY